jgi:hypothetical protein
VTTFTGGRAIPALQGTYLFGDFCLGRLQALRLPDGRVSEHWALGPVVPSQPVRAGRPGKFYALSVCGSLFRLAPT